MSALATATVRAPVRVETVTRCRLCGSGELQTIWSFGETPLANAHVTRDALDRPEPLVPLTVGRCSTCQLVQLQETVDPDLLFRDYLYVSSTSPVFVAHFHEYAAHLVDRFRLSSENLVVDIGSNDGILLKPLQARGICVLGVEPARRIAEAASADGIETMNAFFTPELADTLRRDRGEATVITANNVFAHLPDLDRVTQGIKTLLAANGVYVFEVQYLGDLLAKNLFDIVYHEHLCYYHVTPLVSFFRSFDMEVFDVQRVPVHGGSIRVFVQNAGGPHPREVRLDDLLHEERARGLHDPEPYRAFWKRVQRNKEALATLLHRLRADGKRIAGYGAPAKATTLLSTFGIGAETLEYIVDDDRTFKQGRYMPETHIPIVAPERLYIDRPDFCLVLAWNFADAIMDNHRRFTEAGGQFIIPVPEPRIV